MPYINAEDVLPSELLKEIQKFVQGSIVYIPSSEEKRLGWGKKNGARAHFDKRNADIRAARSRGMGIEELAEEFHLSEDGIRKILYG